jgi:hypothetical protein
MPTLTLGGKTVEVKFEMLDWYLAGRELGIEFLPWGVSEFWQSAETDTPSKGIENDLTLLFVALRKHFPGLTVDGLAAMIPDTETWMAAQEAGREALTDFFLRAAQRAGVEAAQATPPAPIHGPTSTQ